MNQITKKKIFNAFTSILFLIFIISLFILGKLYLYSTCKIVSTSMNPTLQPGDYVYVNKMCYGIRIFDFIKAIKGEDIVIKRYLNTSSIDRGDVIVSHNPYPLVNNKIDIDMSKYYVKRCIGIAGDIIEICDGSYVVNGNEYDWCNRSSKIIDLDINVPNDILDTFPYDDNYGWTIISFGPLYIPKRGDTIQITDSNMKLYGNLINWELKGELSRISDNMWINSDSQRVSKHVMNENYFFIAGDNYLNSKDSRYFGLIPESLIIGKVTKIYYSKDVYTNKVKWERIGRKIQ